MSDPFPTLAVLEQHLDDMARWITWLRSGHPASRKDEPTVLAISELYRRNEEAYARDGWPTGGGTHANGGDVSNPTYAAAAGNADDGVPFDEINRIVTNLAWGIVEARNHLAAAIGKSALVYRRQQSGRHSNEPKPCKACERTVECTEADPIRGGYCQACSTAWYRYKAAEQEAGREPDRIRFERTRRTTAA